MVRVEVRAWSDELRSASNNSIGTEVTLSLELFDLHPVGSDRAHVYTDG